MRQSLNTFCLCKFAAKKYTVNFKFSLINEKKILASVVQPLITQTFSANFCFYAFSKSVKKNIIRFFKTEKIQIIG